MEITVSSPNRVDLAGGTTDLYPLFLLMGGGCVVNVAISLVSRVIVRERRGKGTFLRSEDLDAEIEAASLSDVPLDGPLGLVGRAVRAFPPERAVEIITRNDAPPGSGLGASSALLVSLLTALLRIRNEQRDRRSIINLATNLETAAIGVPAGQQDYIAAAYGGISILNFGHTGFQRQPVEDADIVKSLGERIIVSYTGEGRFSGMNNWDMLKGFIDGRDQVREKLIEIRDVAVLMASALLQGRIEEVPVLMSREWELRRSVADGIETPRIKSIMDRARNSGALAGKICGAGGGGCMVTFAQPENHARVKEAITEAGGVALPVTIVTGGTRVVCSPDQEGLPI
ncbi:MAG: hypothetical protein FJ118_14320 [Deltaproteobacteria bacterium]|nr:hypothetical protein [Deltaproteobacteria bacterium]